MTKNMASGSENSNLGPLVDWSTTYSHQGSKDRSKVWNREFNILEIHFSGKEWAAARLGRRQGRAESVGKILNGLANIVGAEKMS
jgi:hypothetical protein